MVEVDPIGLVRRQSGGWSLAEYVNDRPYVASSHLAVALNRAFGTAMRGRCEARPELVGTELPLEAHLPAVACVGGAELAEKLFAPLGYEVDAQPLTVGRIAGAAGESPLISLRLRGRLRLSELLSHLYVLLPVLDDAVHFWVDQGEIDKLVARGEGWLANHPERELIVRRALRHQRRLARRALAALVEETEDEDATEPQAAEEAIERPIRIVDSRIGTTLAVLRQNGVRTVLDLGCGEGRLLRELLKDAQFSQITGFDVSSVALAKAEERLRLERKPSAARERIRLLHGSVLYRDERLAGHDAICALEVIEHLDPPRLGAFERVVFEFARPRLALITTPNAEYNVRWETLPAGEFRHPDHRFEWSPSEFEAWASAAATGHGYSVRFLPIGEVDPEVGPPTQMAVFERREGSDD